MEKSHLIDGIALTNFLFWLKKNFKNKTITEISAQNKLESFRKMNSKYKFQVLAQFLVLDLTAQ